MNGPERAKSKYDTGLLVLRVFTVAVGLLVVGEVVARLFLTSPSAQQPDPVLGWAYVPGAVVFIGREGGAHLAINSLGLNDEEPTPKGGRTRLAVFGDSFTEALQVAREDNFTSRVEQAVDDVDVVNLGRSDMAPVHYPVLLERYAEGLEPDLLVVVVGPGDVAGLTRSDVTVAYTEAGAIESLELILSDKDQLKALAGPLIRTSALATYMMRRVKPLVLDALALLPEQRAVPTPPSLDEQQLRVNVIARLEWVLRDMQRAAPVVVVHVPELAYHPGRRAEVSTYDDAAWFRAAAERAGVDFIDCGPDLVAAYARTGQPSHGFANYRIGVGHLNQQGHRAVARSIARWLQPRLMSMGNAAP
jgi:lysophospholipase L1-like esterase